MDGTIPSGLSPPIAITNQDSASQGGLEAIPQLRLPFPDDSSLFQVDRLANTRDDLFWPLYLDVYSLPIHIYIHQHTPCIFLYKNCKVLPSKNFCISTLC